MAYRWYSQEHHDQCFLAEYRMLHEGVHESDETLSSLLEKGTSVGCKMISVNFYSFVSYCRLRLSDQSYIPWIRFGGSSGSLLNG